MLTATRSSLKVADEVWIVTALLHRENPRRKDFKVGEIVERAKKEALAGALRPGVYVHAVQHCVANRQPNPARYRILFETGKNLRRLFRKGDSYHHARENGKLVPEREDLPEQYRYLLDWYVAEYDRRPSDLNKSDPLLALRGSGKELWADEHADEYVRRLREGWE